MEDKAYKILMTGLIAVFGIAISYMVIRKLLWTGIKYNFISFDFSNATPQGQISMIILIGLAVIGLLTFIVVIATHLTKKKGGKENE